MSLEEALVVPEGVEAPGGGGRVHHVVAAAGPARSPPTTTRTWGSCRPAPAALQQLADSGKLADSKTILALAPNIQPVIPGGTPTWYSKFSSAAAATIQSVALGHTSASAGAAKLTQAGRAVRLPGVGGAARPRPPRVPSGRPGQTGAARPPLPFPPPREPAGPGARRARVRRDRGAGAVSQHQQHLGSFQRYELTDPNRSFSGLPELRRGPHRPTFLQSLANTAGYFVVITLAVLLMGLATALWLEPARRVARGGADLIVLPWAVPGTVAGVLWSFILNPTARPAQLRPEVAEPHRRYQAWLNSRSRGSW